MCILLYINEQNCNFYFGLPHLWIKWNWTQTCCLWFSFLKAMLSRTCLILWDEFSIYLCWYSAGSVTTLSRHWVYSLINTRSMVGAVVNFQYLRLWKRRVESIGRMTRPLEWGWGVGLTPSFLSGRKRNWSEVVRVEGTGRGNTISC